MVKREVEANVDVDAPRPKRRKDAESNEPSTEDVEMGEVDASSEHDEKEQDEGPTMSPEEVTEEGLKVWHTVKDAVDKEGRPIAPLFMRLPSKRQYPDYYEIIKNPIALDDVKIKLDENAYSSLEELRQDLEMCFKNAKKYNQRESVIWKDAKTLQPSLRYIIKKLVNKEIDKIIRRDDDDVDVEGEGDEEGKKKEKGTNIHRLMKNRLQKLTAKTDQEGRRVCAAFMDLPSRKKWPIYYKLIKRPICIEDIFKKIKRKEYTAVKDFMDDVELVFTNAMEFNEDQSEIWQDAITMKDYFHQIMNHLPAKYGLNNASDLDPTSLPDVVAPKKIMLKLPMAGGSKDSKGAATAPLQTTDTNTSSAVDASQQLPGLGSSADITVPKQANGVNGSHTTKKPKVKSPPTAPAKVSIPTSTPTASSSTPTSAKPQATAQVKPAYKAQQSTFTATPTAQTLYSYTANHYTPQPHAPQTAKPAVVAAPSSVPTPTPAPARKSATPTPATAASILQMSKPATSIHPSAAGIRHVRLVTQPLGRKLDLSSEDGVKSWAMRLTGLETSLVVRSIHFAIEEEEEEAEEDENDQGGEDKAEHTSDSPKKKRGRGRPRKIANVRKAAASGKEESAGAKVVSSTTSPKHRRTSSSTPSLDDVVVKLDGMQIQAKSADNEATEAIIGDGSGEWDVEVNPGSHILEIGKKGNSVLWKVFVERRSA